MNWNVFAGVVRMPDWALASTQLLRKSHDTHPTCKSTILFPRTLPFITWAPVLIELRVHFTQISENVGNRRVSKEWKIYGDKSAVRVDTGRVKFTVSFGKT